MSIKNLSLKRIYKDIKEITESPIEGIGIVSLNNNPYEYIVNIRLMEGIYEGFCLQLLLTISDNYPISPPKILIYPGQIFDNTYHHHIFKDFKTDENGGNFNKFCFDLLENDFLSTKTQYSGWNPSYTISSLLLQVQSFLCNPDMDIDHLPNKDKIDELMKSMENYKRIFVIKNENGEIVKEHTWKNPYPEIFFKNNEDKKENENNKLDNLGKKEKMEIIKENLSCFISRLNYIDDNSILLGYPLKKNKFQELIPIPEILSYDSYMEELLKKEESNINYFRNSFINDFFIIPTFNNQSFNFTENNLFDNLIIFGYHRDYRFNYNNNQENSFKSANNEFYNLWLPIYINEQHFQRNKTTILNYFSIIKYGNLGSKEYDFKPQHIFEVLPKILCKMIMEMAFNISSISSSFLRCYFQYMLLYKKLFENYKNEYRKYIHYYLNYNLKILKSEDIKVNKIFEIFPLFLFSKCIKDPNNFNIFNKFLKKFKNLYFLKLFDNKYGLEMKYPKLFLNDLRKYNLFYKIVDNILLDEEYLLYNQLSLSENTRNKIIKKLKNNFKQLYYGCKFDLKDRLNKIIINNLNFSDYFDLNEIFQNKFNNNLSKYYNFLLIFYALKKKINEKNFFKNLENDYGVYLDSDNFIQEIKEIINNNNIGVNEYIGKSCRKLLKDIFVLEEFYARNIYKFDFYNKSYKYKDYLMNFYYKNCQTKRFFKPFNNFIIDEILLNIRYRRSYDSLKNKISNEKEKKYKIDKIINKKKKIRIIKDRNRKLIRNKFKIINYR